jgi:hypothetical protein
MGQLMCDQTLPCVGGWLKLSGIEKDMFAVGKRLGVNLVAQFRRSLILVDTYLCKI